MPESPPDKDMSMRAVLSLLFCILCGLPLAMPTAAPAAGAASGDAALTPATTPEPSPTQEQAGLSTALPAELLRALVSPKVMDRDKALDLLDTLPVDLQDRLLRALLHGRLLADQETRTLYVAAADGAARPLLAPGASARPAEGLRRVGTSNRQRQRITDVLNARALTAPNVLRRRAAAAALMESAVPPLKAPALRALLDVEKDAPTRASLEAALALHTAADKSATPADLLQAVAALDANGAPTACNALNALADSADPAVAKAAQDALYRQRVAAQWGGFFEMFFFGLSLGSILVLAATGLAITFGVMGVINMAHGEFIMLGAYTAWGVQQMLPGRPGLALLLAVPAALLVSGGMGVLLERTVIRFLYGRPLETLLATFGVSLVLQQAVRSVFSPLNRAVQTPDFMSGVWQITPHFALTCNRVYIMLFCLGVFACIHAAMHRTRLGLEVRAVSQNRPIARCMGVRAARVDALTFGLGSGVAGMAGVALSQVTNVGPNLGQGYIIDSFMVVVFGGVGNLWGTLTGGLALGVANKFLEPVSGAMLSKIIILVCLILFIQKRPRGLFPQKGRAVEA